MRYFIFLRSNFTLIRHLVCSNEILWDNGLTKYSCTNALHSRLVRNNQDIPFLDLSNPFLVYNWKALWRIYIFCMFQTLRVDLNDTISSNLDVVYFLSWFTELNVVYFLLRSRNYGQPSDIYNAFVILTKIWNI